MRLHKHKRSNRRRHAAVRTYGWSTLMRWLANPEPGQDTADHTPPAQAPTEPHYQPLPPLPPGSMPQRTLRLPKLPARTAFPAEDLAAAQRVARSATGRPAYQIRTDMPLFRDEPALAEYEDRYQARLRRIQRIDKPWADGHGVALGSDQSTHTLVISTGDYREFAGDPGRKAGAR